MKTVFVWRRHGAIEVYAADTPEQLQSLVELLIKAIYEFNMTRQVNKVQEYVASYPDQSDKLIKAINYLLDELEVGTLDLFGLGSGFTTIKYLETK